MKNPTLYAQLDSSKRTIFIKDTGDNFRAASRYPTEQTSFSVLNLKEMVNCPYGQFITTLWRGSESREMIFVHVGNHYTELTELVKNGVTLVINDKVEYFNVVSFFVADLCFVKDVLGVCSCTATYGCYHCILPRDKWSLKTKAIGKEREVSKMVEMGIHASNTLGKNPDRNSKLFKDTQLKYYGQWVSL